MKNFEALLNHKQDLKKKIDNDQTQLAESIQERRKIKDYLTGLLELFKLYTSEAEILQEENNYKKYCSKCNSFNYINYDITLFKEYKKLISTKDIQDYKILI